MGTESKPSTGLPADLLAELAEVVRSYGYGVAPAEEVAAALAQVITAPAEGTEVRLLRHRPGVEVGAPAGYCGICVGLWASDAERDAAHIGAVPGPPPRPAPAAAPPAVAPVLALVGDGGAERVDVDGQGPDGADAARRSMRWQQVADAVAAGLAAPPREVRISGDGWSLTLEVDTPEQVAAWAAALAIGPPAVRVFAPARGALSRETYAAASHPYAVRVACAQAVPAPSVPARAVLGAAELAAVAA